MLLTKGGERVTKNVTMKSGHMCCKCCAQVGLLYSRAHVNRVLLFLFCVPPRKRTGAAKCSCYTALNDGVEKPCHYDFLLAVLSATSLICNSRMCVYGDAWDAQDTLCDDAALHLGKEVFEFFRKEVDPRMANEILCYVRPRKWWETYVIFGISAQKAGVSWGWRRAYLIGIAL